SWICLRSHACPNSRELTVVMGYRQVCGISFFGRSQKLIVIDRPPRIEYANSQWQKSHYGRRLRPFLLASRPAKATMVFQLLRRYVHDCSASLIACSEARRKPKTSCKTFGCVGSSLRIGKLLRTRRHT